MLSNADTTVKNMITCNFTTFQSRWQVLFYILTTQNNGFYWNEDGTLEPSLKFNKCNDNFMSIAHSITLNERDNVLGISDYKNTSLNFQTLIACFYQENIELIASTFSTTHFEPFIKSPCYTIILEFINNPELSLLGEAAVKRKIETEWTVEISWQKAISEVIDASKQLICNEFFNFLEEKPIGDVSAWTNLQAFEVYNKLTEWGIIIAPCYATKEKELQDTLIALENFNDKIT